MCELLPIAVTLSVAVHFPSTILPFISPVFYFIHMYKLISYGAYLICRMTQQMDVQSLDMNRGIKATDLPFDFAHQVTTWKEKYGLTEPPLLVRGADGSLYDDRRFKGIFINDNYRRIVSRHYIVYPNEEVDELLRENAAKLNMEIRKTYKSHFGDAMYWELLNEDIEEQVEYKGKNDAVKVGCIVRNSVGTNVALGADLFTWRVFCENGAVARGKDMGFALRHVGGEPEKLIQSFIHGLEGVLAKSIELVEYYRKMAHLRMNKKIAEELSKHLPIRAFPDCMTYDYKNHVPVLKGEADLWTAFNDVTEKVWHYEKTGFLSKSVIEKDTHRIMINAVQGRYA